MICEILDQYTCAVFLGRYRWVNYFPAGHRYRYPQHNMPHSIATGRWGVGVGVE